MARTAPSATRLERTGSRRSEPAKRARPGHGASSGNGARASYGAASKRGRSGNGASSETKPSSAKQLLLETKGEIDRRLDELFEAELRGRAAVDPATKLVHEALRDLTLRGGKRLRAFLCVVGERAAGGKRREAALGAGVALELLQSYFLIHDDWMDQDDLRRGAPSVHIALERHFRSNHKGALGAVLAGDYAVALATRVLSELGLPSSRLGSVMSCFASMQQDAVLGQELDLLAAKPDPATVCGLKTASYTVKGPLLLGALLGGANAALLETLERFAGPIGVAFQWRDDLLGAFADSKQTGKPRGADITAGKPTLLSELAAAGLRGESLRAFNRSFGNAKATPSEVDRVLGLVERSGARQRVEERITALVEAARAIVQESPLDSTAKHLLLASITLLVGRSD